MTIDRRGVLAAAAAWPAAGLFGCSKPTERRLEGGWVSAAHDRGHRLRTSRSGALPAAAVQRRAAVLVVGGGIAGLAAARTLVRAGIDDVQLLELEDETGGNSRAHTMAGMACPLGAHYLPLPGEAVVEVAELLDELGLRRLEHGRVVYDERHLCHSPQERLFIDGHWHDGLLPPIDVLPRAQRDSTRAQYRRFGAAVAQLGAGGAFTVPTARSRWSSELAALDAIPFAQWLDAQGLDAAALRWYLDYCCRDDYGAGAARVSAWAGLHYFASRHGFQAPGDDAAGRDSVLTWPEGNAWLSRRLAEALAGRVHTGRVALRLNEARHEVAVDVWNAASLAVERWTAPRVVLALPLFVAARLIDTPPEALAQAASVMSYAPWLVANLQLDEPLLDRAGAAPSWDNVLYGSPALGYVDAMHQSLRTQPGPTVLTAYWALGGDTAQQAQAQRARLLAQPWSHWAEAVLADLSAAHPDLRSRLRRIDLMRHGHAMAVPVPGLRSHAALQALARSPGRVQFAHADLSAHSVFEEAFFHGRRAARAVLGQISPGRRVS